MFYLKVLHGTSENVYPLGDDYEIGSPGSMLFDSEINHLRELAAGFNDSRYLDGICAFVYSDESGAHPIYVDADHYILNDKGQTFDNLKRFQKYHEVNKELPTKEEFEKIVEYELNNQV